MVSVIVLGSLGDLIKKIAELELLERNPSRDTTIQMAAYYAILDQWPVSDKPAAEYLVLAFKLQLAKHIAVEATIQDLAKKITGKIGSQEWCSATAMLNNATIRYLDSKAQIKQAIILLNSLGKHVGKPPITMELHNEESDNVIHEH